MDPSAWQEIHSKDKSWGAKLIGGLADHHLRPRCLELLEKHFSGGKNLSFLELGSVNGEMAKRVRKRRFRFIERYATSEYFEQGVQWLREAGFEAFQINAEKIPFPDKSFDVVASFDVMHHVDHPRQMAREMMRVARGRLILSESNGLSVGRKLMELTPGHRRAGERSYTPRQYRSFFEQEGFHVKRFEIAPYVFPLYLPRSFLRFEIGFNRWIEKTPFLRWQCSNVQMYVEYERDK